jgi:hypothetical protein
MAQLGKLGAAALVACRSPDEPTVDVVSRRRLEHLAADTRLPHWQTCCGIANDAL